VGFGVAAGLAVGVTVALTVGDGLGEAVAPVDPGVGEPPGLGGTVAWLWMVATAARITVVSPVSVVGLATGSRAADGVTLTGGVGAS
jgi:hypothetical protein